MDNWLDPFKKYCPKYRVDTPYENQIPLNATYLLVLQS